MYGNRHTFDNGSESRHRANMKSWPLFGRSRQRTSGGVVFFLGVTSGRPGEAYPESVGAGILRACITLS